jgi:nucleoside-diphosphate-sugar epimerase
MSIRPLVFGASSAIGGDLLRGFAECDYLAVSRDAPRDRRWLQSGLEGFGPAPDSVTHILSLGPLDAFADWLARSPKPNALAHIVALSSTSAETKIVSSAASEVAIANRLLDAEQRLASMAGQWRIPLTVFRLTMLYGGGRGLVARVGAMARRYRCFPWLIGRGAGALRQPLHVADVAQAVQRALARPTAGLYVLAGAETLSLRQVVVRSAKASASLAVPIPMPVRFLLRSDLASGLSPASLDRLATDQVFDSASAQRTFDWVPGPFRP